MRMLAMAGVDGCLFSAIFHDVITIANSRLIEQADGSSW